MGLFDFMGRKYGYSRRALRQIIYEADQGNARAEEALQHLFARGMSSDEHNKIRRETYEPEAIKGSADAQYWMGLLSIKCPDDSLKWFSLAAQQGHIESMKSLALGYSMVTNSEGSPIAGFGYQPEKELFWYTRAAEAGDPNAMCSLGMSYKLGEGVEKKPEESLRRYTRAANLGYFKAYLRLAELYRTPQFYNQEKAIYFYKKAAEKGDVDMISLAAQALGMIYGGCYVFGLEPSAESNPSAALYWLCQAYILDSRDDYKEYINKLCDATGLNIDNEVWKEWLAEAHVRLDS